MIRSASMRGVSIRAFTAMILAVFALSGCRFELDACSFDSDCADHGCPDGEEPFCDFEGDELFGNCACRMIDGAGGEGGAGGT